MLELGISIPFVFILAIDRTYLNIWEQVKGHAVRQIGKKSAKGFGCSQKIHYLFGDSGNRLATVVA